MTERLDKQLRFLTEIDKLKQIQRRTLLLDESRFENDAEHSWHLAVMAILFAEHSNFPDLDLFKVVKMVLVHDIVEIDAGDTYAYDAAGNEDKLERELKAADRIFGLLPEDLQQEFRQLWDEFEARETPESKYANSIDRFQPLLHNFLTGGKVWKQNKIRREQVIKRCQPIEDGSASLWAHMLVRIDKATEEGLLL